MPNVSQSELPKPKSWDEFEDIVWDVYARLWRDPHADRYGRSGQRQQGVDVYGRPYNLDGQYAGIQCKRYAEGSLTRKTIEAEIAKAEQFSPPLAEFVIATTELRDAKLQEMIRQINVERHAEGKFPVQIVFWETLCRPLADPANNDLLQKHYGDWLARGFLLQPGEEYEPLRPLPDVECPYRGLEPFQAEHAKLYFGRKDMVEQLLAKVEKQTFVALLGPSGSGKSSLVRAGLVASLYKGDLPGSKSWAVRVFRPTADPLRALSTVATELLEPEISEVDRLAKARTLANRLRDEPVLAADLAARLQDTHLNVPRIVLIVDQFEELYTECRDDLARSIFVQALLSAAEQGTNIVLALRADFYGHVLADRKLGEKVAAGQVNVLPMGREELRDAVEQPVLITNRAFEAGLVERILDDVAEEPGNLPLLEFALTELWERQTEQGLLTHSSYDAIGKVAGAIAQRAETVYGKLKEKGQGEVVRRIFQRLTHHGEVTRRSRHRALQDELVTPRTPKDVVEKVVKALSDARLLVTGRDETEGAATVEVSHEALIRRWDRLERWLDEDRVFGPWREKLDISLKIWKDAEKGEGDLLRGARLTEAEGWLDEWKADLNKDERLFIEASLTMRDREAAERERQQEKEAQLAAEQRTAGLLRRLAVGLGVSVLIAIALAGFALILRSEAIRERDARATEVVVRTTAEAEALAARGEAEALKLAFASENQLEQNHELALLLAIESRQPGPSLAADTALWSWFAHRGRALQLFSQHTGEVWHATWSPDNQRIVTASQDGSARVWDAETGEELAILRGHGDGVGRTAWDKGGRRIVTASFDGTARVWDVSGVLTGDVESEVESIVLRGHTGAVWSVAWSSDDLRIATAGQDGTMRVWDAETGAELARLTGHERSVWSTAWSPDNQRIVTASEDGTAKVWDVSLALDASKSREDAPLVLTGHEAGILHASWDRDGRRIVTASKDGTARVWDADSGANLSILEGHTAEVSYAAWDREGRRIVTASYDGTAQVWDVATAHSAVAENGNKPVVLRGHQAAVMHAAWDEEGQRIVTASEEGTARIWDASTGAELAILSGHTRGVWYTEWDKDSRRIVTASNDSTARVWAVDSSEELTNLSQHRAAVMHAAWDEEGQRIVTASADNTARLWDTRTGEELIILAGHEDQVVHAAWDKAGQRIVTASYDGTARVWDADSGKELTTLTGHEDEVVHAAWDKASQRIVTASYDGTARVWDADSGEALITLTGHEDEVVHAAWDNVGQRIATASRDGTARVWDADTGDELLLLIGHEASVMHTAWDRLGQRIVTASHDGTARVWDAETGAELAIFSGHEAEVEAAAWDETGRYIVTAGRDDTARVWDPETGTELAILRGHEAAVIHAAWDKEGRRIVTASFDGTARVWEAQSGMNVTILAGHKAPVLYVAWDQDGRHVVTASLDGTARVYYAGFKDLVQFACEHAVRNLSAEEWQRYLGNELYRETCPGKRIP